MKKSKAGRPRLDRVPLAVRVTRDDLGWLASRAETYPMRCSTAHVAAEMLASAIDAARARERLS